MAANVRIPTPLRSHTDGQDVVSADGNTIARAYYPYENDGVTYGRVEFNTKFLDQYAPNEIAGTIVHEIGHTLGYGWEGWQRLFSKKTGKFTADAIAHLDALAEMLVELDGGSGTALSHWDEQTHDRDLMTGYKDAVEHVLPVTIDVMELLGHQVIERLSEKTALDSILNAVAQVTFSRKEEARAIDRDHFQETELMETVPHGPLKNKK